MKKTVSKEAQEFYQRIKHFNDPSLFDNPEVDQFEIAEAIGDVLVRTELPPESQAFLGGLYKSFYGRSPFHHFKVHKPSKGSKIQFADTIKHAHQTRQMADEIDMAVVDVKSLNPKLLGRRKNMVFRVDRFSEDSKHFENNK